MSEAVLAAPPQPAPLVAARPMSLWREALLVIAAYAASVGLLAAAFPPSAMTWWTVLIALVPWSIATCATRRAWLAHWLSFLAGWGFSLLALRWLFPVTGLGFIALCFYLAIYWVLAGWAIRTAKRYHVPIFVSLPVVWVACEYLRAIVMTGFPWLFLSHALFKQLLWIQVSDLFGAYGVSFLVAMVNGCVAAACLHYLPQRNLRTGGRTLILGALATAMLLLATASYGVWRLGESAAIKAASPGPRIAVIQENFPLRSAGPYVHPYIVFAKYMVLAMEAAQQQPDLIVFPETSWNASQNVGFIGLKGGPLVEGRWAFTWGFSRRADEACRALAIGNYQPIKGVFAFFEQDLRNWNSPRASHSDIPPIRRDSGPSAMLVVGTAAVEPSGDPIRPYHRFNSAVVYDRNGVQRQERYDKNHLVPFGEYVPFRGTSLHWLYVWLNSLSPFSQGGQIEYSLMPGRDRSSC
jgi:apolipoprotein N-acyltransferase